MGLRRREGGSERGREGGREEGREGAIWICPRMGCVQPFTLSCLKKNSVMGDNHPHIQTE